MPTTSLTPGPAATEPVVVRRVRLGAVCAVLIAIALKQAPKLVVGDTKLGIAVNPGRFLSQALHLWNPTTDFGVTQNQGYGYLFPMGPFFLLGDALQLPPWIVQRLWWGLLLCLAFLGMVRLADRLGIGSPTARVLAGLVFALSPRMLTTLGPISVESLPYCLAPWVLAPLVVGSRQGSTRRAAARSAVAVFCMGAVNAAAVLAVLPPAVLWLLTRQRGPRRRSLAGWWVLCVVLATAWWVVPLVLLGRYSPPFLDYIESASATTSVTSLVEVLRGTSDWIAYLAGSHGVTWPAGFALLTGRLVVTFTVVVLLAGLGGLVRRDLRERLWLVSCLLVGAVAVTFGHVGPLSSPLSGFERDLLDGVLAPFRNVHKFDVLLRLPLALGVGHVLQPLLERAAEPGAWLRQRAVLLGATAALVGAALPVLSPGLAPRHPFAEIPGYWAQAAQWLAARPDGRTLVLPGSHSVDYLWGSPNDEPLQPLGGSPWAVRSAIPLTPAGTIRALDAIEARLASGQPSAGLADSLARDGVRYLLVRNDLDYGATGSTRPLLVHAALTGSSGISRVATFGGTIGGGTFGRYADEKLEIPYPVLEVFEVGRDVRRAELHELTDAVRVAGGPEGLLALDDRGLLRGRPVLLGDAAPSVDAPVVLTDSLRRREVFFGRQEDNASATLTRREPYRLDAPAHDYLPPGSAGHESVAAYIGARAVTASSSASDAAASGGADPAHAPYAAVDGDATTSWRSDGQHGPSGAWWRVDFAAPQDLSGLSLRVDTSSRGTRVTSLRVRGDGGSTVVDVPAGGGRIAVSVPGGPSRRLTVQVARTSGTGMGSFGLYDVSLPTVTVGRTLETDRAQGSPLIAIDAAPGHRDACYQLLSSWLCGSHLARAGEDAVALDRTLHVGIGGRYTLSGVVVRPRAGAALDALLAKGEPVEVSASSAAVRDPHGSARAAVDGQPGTGWLAASGDHDPSLTLSWSRPHRLTGLQVVVSDALAASRAGAVRVEAAEGRRTARLDKQGRATFAALTTRSVTVHLRDPALAVTVDPYSRVTDLSPVGVSELRLTGLPAAAPASQPVVLPCGAAPDVQVGATVVHTQLRATTSALASLAPVRLTVCGAAQVAVADGTRVRSVASALLEPVSVTLQPAVSVRTPSVATPVVPARWTASARDLRLPARAVASVLQVHENTNAGWVATFHGRTLQPVVLDGWQQGWLVPAGQAGTVELRYAPDRTYRVGLLAGVILALVLLGLALRPGRAASTSPVGPRKTGPLPLACSGLLVVLVGGGTGIAAVTVSVLLWRFGARSRAALGLLAVGTAGGLLAAHPWATPGYDGRGATAQALCVAGLAVTWSALSGDRDRTRSFRRRSGRSSKT